MTQSEIDRGVSLVTGETVREIRRRGFSLADPMEVHHDPEPAIVAPSIVDWDELDAGRVALFIA